MLTLKTYLTLLPIFMLAIAAGRWAFIPSGRLPRHRVRVMRLRLRLRLHPGRGHATALELWLRWGRFAAWRQAAQSRPSLSAWQRARRPAEHSILLGRAHFRHALRLPLDEHALVLAPPRTGKTAMLGAAILRYPGPVLSTTTKHDVFKYTSGVRARLGPVHVFNPQGIGGVPSTFGWSPIPGCEDPAVAIRRADHFAAALKCEGDNAFFQRAAGSYLRGMFHAAALVRNGDMRLVGRWALTGTKGGAVDAEQILRQNGAGNWADELGQLRGAAERTSATNEMVMGQMLGFMADPALAAAVLPAGDSGLDFAEFLRSRGSLYLIADSDHDESPLAPLFAALAAELHYVAALEGQASAAGRLDPPLLMALDEIVQTCPIALPKYCADSGGKGIQIITVAHGEAQLASRWGEHGKQAIIDTAGVLVLLPGIKDESTLRMVSGLCGTAAYRVRGQEHDSHHEVMPPAMLRQLPKGRALIIRSGFSPVIAKLARVWREHAYRKARRRGETVAVLTPAAAALASPAGREVTGSPASPWPVRGEIRDVAPCSHDLDREAAELAEVLPRDDTRHPWMSP